MLGNNFINNRDMFEKGNTLGNRFSSTNQPKKNGRKPSLYKQLKKMTGKTVGYEMEKEDYYNVIRFLMEQNSETLEKLVTVVDPVTGKKTLNPKTPIWVVNIVSAINTDAKFGRTNTVEMLFDRVFGKSVENVNATVTEFGNTEAMTDEELTAEIARLEAQLQK